MAKKIGAIVSLSIIGILILATIIMVNIDVDYSIKCEKPTYVFVSYNTNDPSKEMDALENTDKIINFINNASKENSLTALFNGTLGKKAEVVAESKSVPTTNGFYVRYRYQNAQKLKVGKDIYKDSNGNQVTYEDLVFSVNDVEGVGVVKVFVVPSSTNSSVYTHYYNLEADFTELFDFLSENYK